MVTGEIPTAESLIRNYNSDMEEEKPFTSVCSDEHLTRRNILTWDVAIKFFSLQAFIFYMWSMCELDTAIHVLDSTNGYN